MKKILIILLISMNLLAWEVNTHRAIDREALKHTLNLNEFIGDSGIEKETYVSEIFDGYEMTYFNYIKEGEKNGISAKEIKQSFEDRKYQDLLEAGTILEDAQWPHWSITPDSIDKGHGRFLNHFYNVQGGCKSLKCEELAAGLVVQLGPQGTLAYLLFSPDDAVEWAYDSSNKYDYTDAMSYFEKGFSESDNKMKEA